MQLLYWIESWRTPWLDAFFSIVTELGGEVFFMAAAIIFFWCSDKGKGYYVLTVGFVGTLLNQFLKILFRIPRPWVKDPNFTIVESARVDATGYSFPSGHTQSAAGTFGAIGLWSKKNRLRIVCFVLIALVAFSRMYLGVHTPLDVGVSLLVAAVLLAVLYPLMKKIDGNPKGMRILLWVLVAISAAQAIYMTVTLFGATEEELISGLKNAYKMLGAVAGMVVVYELDERFIHYPTNAMWWAQILKVVLGLLAVLAVKEGLRSPLEALFGNALTARAVRYFLIVIMAGIVWPLSFRFFGKIGKKAEEAK